MSELDNLHKKIESKKFLSKDELTKELILVLALGHLGGLKDQIYTEEITAKAFEWSPKEFAWSLEKFSKFSENSKVSFYGPIKPGSNTRDLGEDVEEKMNPLKSDKKDDVEKCD